MDIIKWLDHPKQWWKVLFSIFIISLCVVGTLAYKTYESAPPVADFVINDEVLIKKENIIRGQDIFLKYALMDYGSFLGDGGLRGPDFSAEALHQIVLSLQYFFKNENPLKSKNLIRTEIQEILKTNTYNKTKNSIQLSPPMAYSLEKIRQYYFEKFTTGGELVGNEVFPQKNYITNKDELGQLADFFFWGAWLSSATRPGTNYSYTHNWPFNKDAGNVPSSDIIIWSLMAIFVLFIVLGICLFFYGKINTQKIFTTSDLSQTPYQTLQQINDYLPTLCQKAVYKYFALAIILFFLQVSFGILTALDFLISMPEWITTTFPTTVTRAFHTQISVLWIAISWFGTTIWLLPIISKSDLKALTFHVNNLFYLLLIVTIGTAVGIPLGVMGLFGELWRWFGLQGWEFVQFGRFYQYVLFLSFCYWFYICYKGLAPLLKRKQTWSLPNWTMYTIAGMILMFISGFVSSTEDSFVIADFWRWCVVHMWVEAFFELFTTIIISYFLFIVGIINYAVASRVVYLGAVLFLGSGLIGIGHNFYWNGKTIETIALGSVFSTLQVVPLILLTVEAWRFKQLPGQIDAMVSKKFGTAIFGIKDVFIFLIGVNFWNFMGAGVFGFLINLPIINYYQHGTYLTVNHGHAALFGVYGNLAIGAILFCLKWIIRPQKWDSKVVLQSFWALNIGLALMVVLDLFPVGIHQLMSVMEHGLAHARSNEYLSGAWFKSLTWLRAIGAIIFYFGGVIPISLFILKKGRHQKETFSDKIEVAPIIQ